MIINSIWGVRKIFLGSIFIGWVICFYILFDIYNVWFWLMLYRIIEKMYEIFFSVLWVNVERCCFLKWESRILMLVIELCFWNRYFEKGFLELVLWKKIDCSIVEFCFLDIVWIICYYGKFFLFLGKVVMFFLNLINLIWIFVNVDNWIFVFCVINKFL